MHWVAIGKPTWAVVVLPCTAVAIASLVIAGCGSASATGNESAGGLYGPTVPASAIPKLRAIADRAAKGERRRCPVVDINGSSSPRTPSLHAGRAFCSVDSDARANYLDTRRLACQDGSR
jgi:hypothetical protein